MFSGIFTWKLLWLALAWVTYCALHSFLASLRLKHWIEQHAPRIARRYRLLYNLLATALLVPLLVATELAADDWLWRWQGGFSWLSHGVTVLVAIGFLWSSHAYDMREFMGFAAAATASRPRLGLSPLHRFVRHPWYFLGLVWLWTRDMDSARLIAVAIVSGYLWLGSRLEDVKLEHELGKVYGEYRRRVPGLLPRPWRYLRRVELDALRRAAAAEVNANRPAPR
ncbi:MAG: methyltransferase family protein [Gammaproteobacteria bacterium]